MKIRPAQLDDISSIVDVHIKGFEGFFLTLLGKSFLSELYKAFAFREFGILRVLCDEDGKVIGFSAGTVNPAEFYHSLRKDKAILFLLKALPSLIGNPILVIKKLWYAFFYKGEKPLALSNSALLSSIAILPDLSGKSLGKKLLVDYEERVKCLGCVSLYLTTDMNENDGVVTFYERNGYGVESEFMQAGGRKMLTLFKKF